MDNPEALIQQADKLVAKGGSGWSLFGGSDEKFWDAARLYKEAAQAYQLKGNNTEAGKTHEKAADIREKRLKEPTDAADSYVNASDAYRKARAEADEEETAVQAAKAALRCRNKAIELIQGSSSENKANRVSRIKEVVGQIYERDMVPPDLENARIAYKEAADWIRVERELNSNKLLSQYADLTTFIATTIPGPAEKGSRKSAYYEDAIKAYEAIIKSMQGNGNMRWSLPPYYFKVCVCRLAQGDLVHAGREFEKYQAIDNEVSSQYKYKLLFDLIAAIDEKSQEKFATLLKEFDRTSKLDKWQTDVFLDVKESIPEQDDEFA